MVKPSSNNRSNTERGAGKSCILCGSNGELLYHGLNDRFSNVPGAWDLRRCSDERCGLVWIDPMLTGEYFDKAYRDYYTHPAREAPQGPTPLKKIFYAARAGYIGSRLGYPAPRWQRFLGAACYLHPGARVHAESNFAYQPAPAKDSRFLEIGFGSGKVLKVMSDAGWDAEGVDTDALSVDEARKNGLKASKGTLEGQKYPDNSFDVISMSHVIEHVSAPVALLQECRRILKPGGRLVIATPNLQSLGHRLFKASWLHLDPPRHLFLFDAATLKKTVLRSGLDIETSRTTVRGAGTTFLASNDIRKYRTHAVNRKRTVFEKSISHLFYYIEWAVLKLRPLLGEELLLTARKR